MNDQMIGPASSVEYGRLNQLERPRKTFFYQKKDANGDIIKGSEPFACYEQEAGLYGKFHKLLGVSDGQAYYNYIKNAGIKSDELIPMDRVKEILYGAFNAELEVARGHLQQPKYQNVNFDSSFPEGQRAGFVPPR